MKKFYITLLISVVAFSVGYAQKSNRVSVSILGDSYSTFEGYVLPDTNAVWYQQDKTRKDNDVTSVEQTWWYQLLEKNDWKLCVNNSFSGSTISSSGYGGNDYTDRSFVTRAPFLGNPDVIFIFGGTNDSWVPSPIGEYKESRWTTDDLKAFRPSLEKLLYYMKRRYLGVDIYFILNSELSDKINASVNAICTRYSVPVIELHDIDKKAGHPSIEGMKAISQQVDEFIKQRNKKKLQ